MNSITQLMKYRRSMVEYALKHVCIEAWRY